MKLLFSDILGAKELKYMKNSLAEKHPELVAEWSERNLPLTPMQISYGSKKYPQTE